MYYLEQEKQIKLCKIPAHTGIMGNKKANKAVKEVTAMILGYHTTAII